MSRQVLEQCASEPTLCAFDFDGTLSPIVTHPALARMRKRTRLLLAKLTALYPCIIISGRSRADLIEKLEGVGVARAIGNHGAETDNSTRASRLLIEKWKTSILHQISPIPGVWVEDKGLSLAVHYRQSIHKFEARWRILHAARQLRGARIFGGKQVVNLSPAGAPNKGEALAYERDRLKCSGVVYVGDDENDEDAFAIKGRIVSVRIGRNGRSRASYYLRTQREIDVLLELLISLRLPVSAS